MKHVPTPQESVIAALAVLDDLQAQWKAERARQHIAEELVRVRARNEEAQRRVRIRARARALAERERDAAAERELARRRSHMLELERVESRARARAAERVQQTRRHLDAQLTASARSEWGRVAGVALFGLVALGLFGGAVVGGSDQAPTASALASHPADTAAAVEALHERLDALASRQAMLAQAHAALIETRMAPPPIPEVEPPSPAPAKSSKSSKSSKPSKSSKSSKASKSTVAPKSRPPIVLEVDGNPLDGIG